MILSHRHVPLLKSHELYFLLFYHSRGKELAVKDLVELLPSYLLHAVTPQ